MIERHKITRDVSSEIESARLKLDKFKIKVAERLHNGSNVNLSAYSRMCLRLPTYKLVLGSNENVISDLVRYLEAGIAHFKVTMTSAEQVTIILENQPYVVLSKKSDNNSLFEWWNLLMVAILIDDKRSQEELHLVHDQLRDQSNDPFWRRFTDLFLMSTGYIEFEKTIWDDIESIVNSGITQFHGLDGNRLIKSDKSKNLKKIKWLPLAEICNYSQKSDKEKVNETIKKYLKSKKEWIIKNKEEDDMRFWIDFPLLGTCKIVKNNNIPIEIESEYLPDINII